MLTGRQRLVPERLLFLSRKRWCHPGREYGEAQSCLAVSAIPSVTRTACLPWQEGATHISVRMMLPPPIIDEFCRVDRRRDWRTLRWAEANPITWHHGPINDFARCAPPVPSRPGGIRCAWDHRLTTCASTKSAASRRCRTWSRRPRALRPAKSRSARVSFSRADYESPARLKMPGPRPIVACVASC